MSSRPLSPSSRAEEVHAEFQREVLAEKAATLGRAGRVLEAALAKLRDAAPADDRDLLVQAAADAAHVYLIQREVCGIHGLGAPLDDFAVPGEVRVRIGARPRSTSSGALRDRRVNWAPARLGSHRGDHDGPPEASHSVTNRGTKPFRLRPVELKKPPVSPR